MRKLAGVFFSLLLLIQAANASLSDYLALRKKHGVVQSVGVDSLQSFVGTKTLEIRGTVNGTFRVGDAYSLLLERGDGETYVVDSETTPDWLIGSDIPARLLVRATREGEYGTLHAKLIAAVREEEMAAYESKFKPKAAVKPSKVTGRPASRTSRAASARLRSLPASEVTPIYASFIKSRNKRLSNSEAYRIAQGIIGFSLRYGVDARLIMAMVMVESGFNPGATSRAGAMGLGQLMPGTAQGLGVRNAYDTVDNLYGTVKLVRSHLDDYRQKTGQDFDSLVLALAAYNAGPGAVKRHGGVPPYRETQNYVRKVIGLYYAFLGRA
ncbi:MAG TPA: lytic transglycosylase domain-containing protein [Fimbriimonas sp.]